MELREVDTLVGTVDTAIFSKGPCGVQLVVGGLKAGSAESRFPTPDVICYRSIVTGDGSKLIPSFCFPK